MSALPRRKLTSEERAQLEAEASSCGFGAARARGLRKPWGVNVAAPQLTTTAHEETCRRCKKAIAAGDAAQCVSVALGGMYACVDCDFYASGERR